MGAIEKYKKNPCGNVTDVAALSISVQLKLSMSGLWKITQVSFFSGLLDT